MRIFVLMVAVVLSSSATADIGCISMQGSTLINECETCTEVTTHELRPRAEQPAGLFTGVSRTIRLEAGARETLPGGEGWAISDLKACH
jgi:hypothetical protein